MPNKDDKNPDLKSDGEAQFYSDTLKKHFLIQKTLSKKKNQNLNGMESVR